MKNIDKKQFNKLSIFCVVVFFLFVISGCAKNNDDVSDANDFNCAYSENEIILDAIRGELVCTSFYESEYFVITKDENVWLLNIYNSHKQETEIIELNVSEGEEIRTISVGDRIYAVVESSKKEYYLVGYDDTGSECNRVQLNDVEEQGMNRIAIDDDGKVYFSNSVDILVYDNDLNNLGRIEDDNRIIGVAINKNGKIYSVLQKEGNPYVGGGSEYYLCDIDSDKMAIKKNIKLDKEPAIGRALIDSSMLDFCIRMNDGIYTVENDTLLKIFDYNCSYVNVSETGRFFNTEENEFSEVVSENGKCVLKKYTKTDFDVNKKVVTFGCFGENENLLQTVTDFNRKSDDVFVKVIDYGEDKSGVDKFNIDIASGKGPDVFCIGGYQSLDNLRSKGVCENLNAFFEKDKEISKDDFIDSYIKATDFNGETYMISDSFQISTLVTRKNDYISDYECTIEGFEQYINSAGDDTKLLFTDLPQIDLFVFFAENSLKYYIDYEKKECKLNSFGFKEIMRICYDKGVEENDYEFVEMSEKEFVDLYKSGEALFMFDPRLGDMKRLRKMFGDDLCICGYPDMGSFFYPTNEICMNSKSNNKDDAWQFIRYFLSDEHQVKIESGDGDIIPTRKDSYNGLKRRLSSKEDYVDAYGNTISALDEPVDMDDLSYYDELINHTDKYVDLNLDLEAVLFEEANSYFDDEHDLDTAVELMENRVNTYLKEHK